MKKPETKRPPKPRGRLVDDTCGDMSLRRLSYGVLSYADQVGVDTGSLRKRMRLELDMPVLLDSTVPLITAMNALHELEGLKNWNHFPILLGRIVASELSPLHAQLAKSTKTVGEWLEVLPPTESLIGDIGNLHMRSANDCCELIWELSLPRHPAASLVTDAMLVATARSLDLVTIEPSPPIKVLLPRKAHPGDAALKKELGGDIVYGAQVAGLVYPLDFFARAVQQISGLLPAIGAFQSGDTSPAEMRISPFIARLSNTILTHLHRNGAPIETVASALFHVSPYLTTSPERARLELISKCEQNCGRVAPKSCFSTAS